MRLFGFLLLLFYSFSTIGQTNSSVPIGAWRTHLPTTSVATVSIVSNKIYAASPKSSFTFDISDNHAASLSKIDGLTQRSHSRNDPDILVGWEIAVKGFVEDCWTLPPFEKGGF